MPHPLQETGLSLMADTLKAVGMPEQVSQVVGRTFVFVWDKDDSVVAFASTVQNVLVKSGFKPEVRIQFPDIRYLGETLCRELLITAPGMSEFWKKGELDGVVNGQFFLLP